MPGTCLVVACWCGDRRQPTPAYEEDRGYLLRTQARTLSGLRHSLACVVLAVASNPGEPPAFREALEAFPRSLGGAEVRVVERENEGLSYGSWDRVLRDTWRDFDHHILCEDDYVFAEDGFDSTLAGWHDSLPDCGYLCGLVQQAGARRFAGLSNGILRSSVYPAVAAENGGRLPYTPGQRPAGHATERYLDEGGQIAVGASWEGNGRRLYDLTRFCAVPWYMNGFLRCVPHESGRMVIVPVQLLEWMELGVEEARCIGEPGRERTMFPYPPPAWFHRQAASRAALAG